MHGVAQYTKKSNTGIADVYLPRRPRDTDLLSSTPPPDDLRDIQGLGQSIPLTLEAV
jgi:predicted flap endonuclease-1-like 5' DNA nuclease